MRRFKKILWALLIIFIAIQFIQPARNKNGQVLPTDITNQYQVHENVKRLLVNACYDCHSNNTNYPWYTNIQPMGWMMARHVNRGKKELNFSDFGSYSVRRQISKLKGIAGQIKDDEMPLFSYEMMHKNARLSESEKQMIIRWMTKTADSLSSTN